MKGTKAEPITVADCPIDRRYKWCRCSGCGRVAICTPEMDYWFPCRTEDGTAQLLCEPCHDSHVVRTLKVDKIIDIRPQQRQRQERSNN